MASSIEKFGNGQRSSHSPVYADQIEPAPSFAQDSTFRILVGIPAYNEEVAIGSVILRSSKYSDKTVVVDDCSRDSTVEVVKLAGADVICHEVNQGKGAGIRNIFYYAKKENFDILVLLDGDGQHNPDEIPLLIEPIRNGKADIVIGSRFIVKGMHNVPKYRRVGQEVLTIATNLASGYNITDSQSGFRAFSKNTFDCFSFQQNGMAIESEMLIEAARANLRISEVPVNIRYDVDCSTFNPVKHGFSVLNPIFKLIVQRNPLLFFGIPGVILFLMGMAFMFMVLDTFNATRHIETIYVMAFLVCSLTGLLGLFNAFALIFIRDVRSKPSAVR
ncbi:dolichyl-phosphate mannose synthase [Methanocella sp. CWC-04]|uniref:Dolichyl-phosphate mannose synthase n=1 Tax=Methanooceanicella nereidis TaxID=2052831 RepID=A0AAP2RF04_9EURY|nr:glycosyltransferase family 2 protein [Methanocella sp. CWC-04]MCD1294880.1 dolichyl-phosphate mannose synthase [Methanocella sp. CWC-04]